MTWRKQTIGEICDEGGGEVRTGPFGSQLHESDYSDSGTPVVMPKDIIEGKVSERSIARISEKHVARLENHQLHVGDIVYGRRGDIGRQALIRPREAGWLCGTGCLRIRLGDAEVDPGYLHYFLRHPEVIAGIAQQAVGATMPNLNTAILRGISVRYPALDQQRRIASVLSAYDDLIGNDTRRIAILEEMARRIYEDWFVRFRFPGHERVRMVESELGLVPEGWSVQGLYDVADLTYGFPFKSNLFSEGGEGICVIRIRDIRDDCSGTRTTEDADPKYRVTDGDILVGMDGAFHMGRWAGGAAWLNQRVVRFRPKAGIPASWLVWTTEAPIKTLEATIVGTTVAHLSARDLKAMRVLLPSSPVLAAAASVLEPMSELVLTLKKRTAILRTTRDFLLPKLVSGELDVSELPEPEALAA